MRNWIDRVRFGVEFVSLDEHMKEFDASELDQIR